MLSPFALRPIMQATDCCAFEAMAGLGNIQSEVNPAKSAQLTGADVATGQVILLSISGVHRRAIEDEA